jgi:hypothetical protein
MASKSTAYDVFVSHSARDKHLVRQVASACAANGLRAFIAPVVPAGRNVADAIREALSESRAVIVVLSQRDLPPSMAIEIGGAWAWNKPIHVLLTDPAASPPLPTLSGRPIYTPSRIDDLVRAILRGIEEFSQPDLESLKSVYAETGVSVDELALDAELLETLVSRFARLTGKSATGERLLSELLRLRKQGKLVKKLRKKRPKRNKDSA